MIQAKLWYSCHTFKRYGVTIDTSKLILELCSRRLHFFEQPFHLSEESLHERKLSANGTLYTDWKVMSTVGASARLHFQSELLTDSARM